MQAVDAISFDVLKGETLGIVGESGCGKSTTARLLIGLIKPDAGHLIFDGEGGRQPRSGVSIRKMQRSVQMVFQDSYASLNPRLTVQDTDRVRPAHQRPFPRRSEKPRGRGAATGRARPRALRGALPA